MSPDQKNKASRTYKPAYIEAKRAKRYSNKLLSKEFITGDTTCQELKDQIKERLLFGGNRRNYILVWGIWDSDKEIDNTPEAYLAKLTIDNDFKIDKTLRWMPLGWDPKTSTKPIKSLRIEKWCWILLGEISQRKS